MSRDTEYTATFPAGEYYIGDLCYVMHAEWGEVCNLMFAAAGDDMVEDRGVPDYIRSDNGSEFTAKAVTE